MKRNPLAYLLVGDSFLTQDKRRAIIDDLKKGIQGEISELHYRLSETSLEKVLADARTLPFLISAQAFCLSESDVLKAKDREILSRYLENPSPSSYLIFEADEMERDSDFVRQIDDRGQVIFLTDREKRTAIARLIKEKLKQHGKSMAPRALAMLEEQIGDAPAFLDTLLEKIITYAGRETLITENMVELFEEDWKESNVFKWTDAIMAKDGAAALRTLNHMVEKEDFDAVALLGILHWQIKRFWKARLFLDRGMAPSDMLRECRISQKQAPFFMQRLKTLRREELEGAVEALFQLDWKLKTGREEGNAALERWIAQVTS